MKKILVRNSRVSDLVGALRDANSIIFIPASKPMITPSAVVESLKAVPGINADEIINDINESLNASFSLNGCKLTNTILADGISIIVEDRLKPDEISYQDTPDINNFITSISPNERSKELNTVLERVDTFFGVLLGEIESSGEKLVIDDVLKIDNSIKITDDITAELSINQPLTGEIIKKLRESNKQFLYGKNVSTNECPPLIVPETVRKSERDVLLKSVDNLIFSELNEDPEYIIDASKTADEIISSIIDNNLYKKACSDCLDREIKKIRDIELGKSKVYVPELNRLTTYYRVYYREIFIFHYYFYTLLTYHNTKTIKLVINNVTSHINQIRADLDSTIYQTDIGNAIKEFTSELIENLDSDLKNYTLGVDTITDNNVDTQSEKLLEDIINLFNRIGDDSRLSSDDFNVLYEYNLLEERITSGFLFDYLTKTSRDPTSQELEDNDYIGNILEETEESLDIINQEIKSLILSLKQTAKISSGIIAYRENLLFPQFLLLWDSIKEKMLTATQQLINVYEISQTSQNESRVISTLQITKCCDTPLMIGSKDVEFPDTTYKSITEFIAPDNEELYINKLLYWKYYAHYLNRVSSNGDYDVVGWIVPSPIGPKKIKMPIEWIPITVSLEKGGMTVVWLTICGAVVTPISWRYTFPPKAKNKSSFSFLYRSDDVLIKNDTGFAMKDAPVKYGQDLDPLLHMTLPIGKDDLPTPTRMAMLNTAYILYLKDWMKTSVQFMGLE